MRKALFALAATLALSACAEGPGFGYYGGETAFYDDAYGPFYDGYWSGDTFFYSTGRGHAFVRDSGHHFRHDEATGFHGVHTHGGFRGFHHGHG